MARRSVWPRPGGGAVRDAGARAVAFARARTGHQTRPGARRIAAGGLLWAGAAAALGASGDRTARRAALRGIGAVAMASAVTRALARPAAAKVPPLDASGHAASAAAFAAGVLLEAPRHRLVVVPGAVALTVARIRSGVRHPGDVAVGVAIGVGAAALTARWWPVKPGAAAAAAPPRRPAPALPEGAGLHIVVNPSSGPAWSADAPDLSERLRSLLPKAGVTVAEDGQDLAELMERAALRAKEEGGALGACGGDGTVNVATSTAARIGVPLAVFPGGTFNHFAVDLGNQTLDDVVRAVRDGDAVVSDLGRARAPGGREQVFLNTFSLGVYSDLVGARERLERRIGKWPALVVGLAQVLATGTPVSISVNGTPKRLWLLFAGNGIYHPAGFAPTYRTQLDDGLLDVRAVDGAAPLARTRLLLAVLTGTLHNSRVLTTAQVRNLRLEVLEGDPQYAYDGEVTRAERGRLVLDKLNRAVTLYRPAERDQWLR
ncbi:diacylglycerol/lipid kinase family protein [Streptomyces sp. NPDC008313]|uniref:diacylglycerol/lipid kinase family protein n=1 Tax=Streptomyces sp. NPDC008313 TaxID=3364826 RepID=UPI0036F00BAA